MQMHVVAVGIHSKHQDHQVMIAHGQCNTCMNLERKLGACFVACQQVYKTVRICTVYDLELLSAARAAK